MLQYEPKKGLFFPVILDFIKTPNQNTYLKIYQIGYYDYML